MMPFFMRSLTLVPRSLLLNCMETVATHARFSPFKLSTCNIWLLCFVLLPYEQNGVQFNWMKIAQ